MHPQEENIRGSKSTDLKNWREGQWKAYRDVVEGLKRLEDRCSREGSGESIDNKRREIKKVFFNSYVLYLSGPPKVLEVDFKEWGSS